MRAAVAITLKEKHKMREVDIAKKLGIAQAAVSKYISRSYSSNISALVDFINEKNLQKEVVNAILAKKGNDYIINRLDSAASGKGLVRKAQNSQK